MLRTNRYEDPRAHLPLATESVFLDEYRISLAQTRQSHRVANDRVALHVHYATLSYLDLNVSHSYGFELALARLCELVRRILKALDRDKP